MPKAGKLTRREKVSLGNAVFPSIRAEKTTMDEALKDFPSRKHAAIKKYYLLLEQWNCDPGIDAGRDPTTGQFCSLKKKSCYHLLKTQLPVPMCEKLFSLTKKLASKAPSVGLNNAPKEEALRVRSTWVYNNGKVCPKAKKYESLFHTPEMAAFFAGVRKEVSAHMASTWAGKKASRRFGCSAAKTQNRPVACCLNYYKSEHGHHKTRKRTNAVGLGSHVDTNAAYATLVLMLTPKQPDSVPGLTMFGERIEDVLEQGRVVFFPRGIPHCVDATGSPCDRATLNFWY